MTKNMGKPAMLAAAMLLTACSNSQEIFRPFDVDKTSLSADAKQRVIISGMRGSNGETRRIVCAEPSPDAVSAIAASVGANLAATVPVPVGGQVVTPEVQLAFQRAIAEQVAYVGVRNSTIQLLRDGLYRACEAYMNGALGDFGYALILSNYGRLMVGLLAAEGITRPPFTSATVLTSQANGSGGSAAPAAPQAPAASAQGGGTAGLTPSGSSASDRSVELVVQMVSRLADPHADASGRATAIDVVLACLIWAEQSPLRPRSGGQNDILADACREIVNVVPGAVKAVFNTNGATTPSATMASIR